MTGEKPFTFMLRRDETAGLSASELEIEEQVWDVVDLTETGLMEIYLPVSVNLWLGYREGEDYHTIGNCFVL